MNLKSKFLSGKLHKSIRPGKVVVSEKGKFSKIKAHILYLSLVLSKQILLFVLFVLFDQGSHCFHQYVFK